MPLQKHNGWIALLLRPWAFSTPADGDPKPIWFHFRTLVHTFAPRYTQGKCILKCTLFGSENPSDWSDFQN